MSIGSDDIITDKLEQVKILVQQWVDSEDESAIDTLSKLADILDIE